MAGVAHLRTGLIQSTIMRSGYLENVPHERYFMCDGIVQYVCITSETDCRKKIDSLNVNNNDGHDSNTMIPTAVTMIKRRLTATRKK